MRTTSLSKCSDPGTVERLVVAPHADDESLGCGGLLAKHHESTAVVVLAQPDPLRDEELRAAQEVLGYETAYLLDFLDGYVGDNMHALVGVLDEVLNVTQPQELYLPFPSLHQDHVAAYEAGMRSARLSMTDGHWFPPTVLVYDVAAYDVALYPSDLRWNVFEELDEVHIDAKVKAALSYTSQVVEGPHPINSLKSIAQSVGGPRHVGWAEQYALVREVRTAPRPTPDDVAGPGRGRVPVPRHPLAANGVDRGSELAS